MSARDRRSTTLLTMCGSLQRRSANRAALDVAAARALAGGAVVDDYRSLADVPAFDVDAGDAPGAAVVDWRRRVARADAVLIAAPEYAGGVAGVVKNALDWLVGTGELYRKPVAVLSAATSGGIEARRTTGQTLSWQGAYVVGELGIAAPRTKVDAVGGLSDEATVAAITALVDGLLRATVADAAEVVALTTRVVAALGIDTVHIPPAT
jgi:NAD(P)H-dependent FMN reductase